MLQVYKLRTHDWGDHIPLERFIPDVNRIVAPCRVSELVSVETGVEGNDLIEVRGDFVDRSSFQIKLFKIVSAAPVVFRYQGPDEEISREDFIPLEFNDAAKLIQEKAGLLEPRL